ncbi:aminotransferase class IV [Algibacter agarivorans]|uniref:branched-chain-amino-acid transaminase n=2 Tax=Algibacter agarivorans TaxID=1109741 RepID=A0ABP9GGM9_9FLAO
MLAGFFMTNFNGTLLEDNTVLSPQNRGYAYGDALFETIKTSYGKVLFWEDHYFRLMASMRIMRMEIPMNFTMEFLQEQILSTLEVNQLLKSSARIKLMVHRNEGGLYTPETNNVSFIISAKPIQDDFYILNNDYYEVDLFKDYYVSPSLLSTLKTNNKALNVVGSIYAKENNLNNCLLLNTDKKVIEALNGNVFLVKGHVIKTPPISDGCLKGVMRTQLINIIKALPEYELVEDSISPFELQKADEIFITNVIVGIQPVNKYRKKVFTNEVSKILLQKLNVKIRLN